MSNLKRLRRDLSTILLAETLDEIDISTEACFPRRLSDSSVQVRLSATPVIGVLEGGGTGLAGSRIGPLKIFRSSR